MNINAESRGSRVLTFPPYFRPFSWFALNETFMPSWLPVLLGAQNYLPFRGACVKRLHEAQAGQSIPPLNAVGTLPEYPSPHTTWILKGSSDASGERRELRPSLGPFG